MDRRKLLSMGVEIGLGLVAGFLVKKLRYREMPSRAWLPLEAI